MKQKVGNANDLNQRHRVPRFSYSLNVLVGIILGLTDGDVDLSVRKEEDSIMSDDSNDSTTEFPPRTPHLSFDR